MASLSGFISLLLFTHAEAEPSLEMCRVQLVLASVMLAEEKFLREQGTWQPGHVDRWLGSRDPPQGTLS